MPRLLPTGECWCGCGRDDIRLGSFFAAGHDRLAESAVIRMKYGGVPEFLIEHGFGPGGENLTEAYRGWKDGFYTGKGGATSRGNKK